MTANYAVTPQARRIIVNDTVIDEDQHARSC